jgi:Na+/H+ antiporter NhaD/arsenite permease-like protein
MSLLSVTPFIALLLCMACAPLWLPHWWESNRHKLLVVLLLALPVLVTYGPHRPAALAHAGTDYLSFVIMLGGLFVVSAGVRLRGDLVATPATNTAFLAVGGLLASFVGTTGASMLLIRPLLETNQERTHVRHTVVFFILIVSNIGGMLTPLGDPPLFLGYLAGVPFSWTFRLWPIWATLISILLAAYFIYDSVQCAREPQSALQRDRTRTEPIRLEGAANLVWLLSIVVAVAVLRAPWREAVIVSVSVLSFLTTPSAVRRQNRFDAGPMIEVAVLFLGIFVTMVPALELLHDHGSHLGVREPWQFFWATGLLSSVLDNAPTYRAFLALGQSLSLSPQVAGVPHAILAAISVGAVAMGANSYIGNAPNLMVRALAEHTGVRMPGFFGYMGVSAMVLMPLYLVVTLLFFR